MNPYTPKKLASKRRDETVMLEEGVRVETDLYWENNQRWSDGVSNLLYGRMHTAQRNRKWGEFEQDYEARLLRHIGYPVEEHGVMCLCDPCSDAVKRLLVDVGVLPSGTHRRPLNREEW